MPKPVLLISLSPELLNSDQALAMQPAAPELDVVFSHDRAQIEGLIDRVEIVVGHLALDLLPRAHNLRWIQQWGAGADWLQQYPAAERSNFVLTNASGVHAIPISEHIMALFLTFARGLHRAQRAQAQHAWNRAVREHVRELAHSTLLVVGVGAIGARTAQIARGMGMRVLGIRRDPARTLPDIEAMYGPDQLRTALPEADWVTVTLPLTAETRGLFGEAELRVMKPSAFLVNIGRGGTIQEEALVRALQLGWIAGAGLDVFEHEPLPPESPLWDMDNVIITAHYAGGTPHYSERAMAIFLDNLQRYRTGQPLRNVVDPNLGY